MPVDPSCLYRAGRSCYCNDRRTLSALCYTDCLAGAISGSLAQSAAPPSVCSTPEVDDDGDGLIELCYLEDLDAVRYRLDGSAYQADSMATTSTLGCPSGGCRGYELVRDLDFADAANYLDAPTQTLYTKGAGWLPIGDMDSPFSGTFAGNNHRLSHLHIQRHNVKGAFGLFAETTSTAHIDGLALVSLAIDIASHNRGTSKGDDELWVGALVARNRGAITSRGGLVAEHTIALSADRDAVELRPNAFAADAVLSVRRGTQRLADSASGDSVTIAIEQAQTTVTFTVRSANRQPRNYRDAANRASYYADADGWQPLEFRGIHFDGNGHTIANLKVQTTGRCGLFAYLGVGSRLSRVGLLDVEISGGDETGALVAFASERSRIDHCYVSGRVMGGQEVGGLVGDFYGLISHSRSSAAVTGSLFVGGLGGNASSIIDSYASGDVIASGNFIGGLVGQAVSVIGSHASGTAAVGGLVGTSRGSLNSENRARSRFPVSISNSYWNIQTSGVSSTTGVLQAPEFPDQAGTSLSTVQMQSSRAPGTASTEAYYNWSVDDWDFGSSTQYPAVRRSGSTALVARQRASLASLTVQVGEQLLYLDTEQMEHDIGEVDFEVDQITVAATITTPAMVTVDGEVLSDGESRAIDLAVLEPRRIRIVLVPSFHPSRLTYTATITISTVTVVPTLNNVYATIEVNGRRMANGSFGSTIDLAPDATTTLTVAVTARDGITEETYTVVVSHSSTPPFIRVRSRLFFEAPLP